jgi:predicted NBD/HSP70 family sugar kinase
MVGFESSGSDTEPGGRRTMLIGVDFSGPTLSSGVVERGAVVRTRSAEVAPGLNPGQILDLVAREVRRLAETPEAVGLAIPGQVNEQGRCWRLPNVPAFEGLPIAEELSIRLDCPVAVENRATAAALAERMYGHGRAHPSFILVTLGAGVGGGVVIGHQLNPGTHGFGGEIGHICVDASQSAPICSCGKRGCLEAFIGARAVLSRFTDLGGQGLLLSQVVTSARRGELAGVRTLEAVGESLGWGLAFVQNLLDLNGIVLTGPLAAAFDLLEGGVRQELRKRAFSPLLAEVPILLSDLGEAAGILGAAYLTRL